VSNNARPAIALTAALSFGAPILYAQTPAAPAAPAKPQCSVSDVAATTPPTASAFPQPEPAAKKPAAPSLAEDVRKAIFVELQQVVTRAQREAATAYPAGDGAPILSPTNVAKPAKLSEKREGMAISLERSYLAELLTRRSIACTTARDIMREGRAANWPVKKPEP